MPVLVIPLTDDLKGLLEGKIADGSNASVELSVKLLPESDQQRSGADPPGGFNVRFAEERSHVDAQMVSEHARATAQTTILINGGAATAALAFAGGYEHLTAEQLSSLGFGLIYYGIGVGIGAYDLASVTSASFHHMVAWQHCALGEKEKWKKERVKAEKYQKRGNNLFRLGFTMFGIASFFLAVALIILPLKSKPDGEPRGGTAKPAAFLAINPAATTPPPAPADR